MSQKQARTSLRIEIAPRTILFVLLAIAAVWLAFELATVLTVLIVALVLVGTLDPLVAWFERRGIRRGRALVLVFTVIILAISAVLLLTIPPLVSQLLTMLESLPKVRDSVVDWLRQYKWAKPLVQAIRAVPINDLVVQGGNRLLGYSQEILMLIGYGISTMFLSIYLLADPVRAKGLLYAVVPRHHHVKLARILLELKVIVGGYMRGQLITSVSIFAFVFALLSVYNVENALALALFAGLTDIIPFVGGYIASAPVIIAVVPHGSTSIILVTIIMFIYQEFESRILVPRVYGRVLRLSPAIVIIALLIGGTLMGILGALIALPIAAGVQMVVRELRVELPGDAPPSDVTKARDEKAENMYERLTDGKPAVESAVIASQLAHRIKETEQKGLTLSGMIPIQAPPPSMTSTKEIEIVAEEPPEDLANPDAEASKKLTDDD